MSLSNTTFTTYSFIRTGGGVSFEERPAQPSDFTDRHNGGNYAKEYADNPSTFLMTYPNWQEYADAYMMRRAIITISGRQRCQTKTFNASDLKRYTDVGFVTPHAYLIPDATSSMPGGRYQLTSMSFSDNGDGYTDVMLSYQQYGDWKLVQVSSKLPKLQKVT